MYLFACGMVCIEKLISPFQDVSVIMFGSKQQVTCRKA